MGNSRHLLIAGIGGFIGKRLAEIALERGYSVSGFDRDIRGCRELSEAGAHIVEADITDPSGYQTLLDAQPDAVINTVAVVKETGDWDLFRRINVEATRELAERSRHSGIGQFVQLSSVMVYGLNFRDQVDEDGPLSGDNNPYCTTKIEGERALRELEDDRFGVTVIRPGDVYGPGSIPWVVRPLEMRRKLQFFLVDGGTGRFNYVFIDNLADGILSCVGPGMGGKTYTITDGCVSNREYFNKLMAAAGYGPLFSLPSALLYPLCRGIAGVAERLGRTPDLTPQAVDYMLRPGAYSSERARRELGYTVTVTLEAGLARTRDWLLRARPDLVRK